MSRKLKELPIIPEIPSFFLLIISSETPGDQLSSSSRKTSNIVVEMKMDEQMSKGQVTLSPTKSLDTFRSTSGDSEKKKIVSTSEGNGYQLDSRLTKIAPSKTTSIGTNSNSAHAVPASPNIPIRLLMSNAGKASPYKTLTVKINGNNQVDILNGNVSTAYGALAKVTCVTAKTKAWELFVGSPIVNFSLCAKYVLICCLDGTIQFVDIKTGIGALPKMKMLTPAVQCVFVSGWMLRLVFSPKYSIFNFKFYSFVEYK